MRTPGRPHVGLCPIFLVIIIVIIVVIAVAIVFVVVKAEIKD